MLFTLPIACAIHQKNKQAHHQSLKINPHWRGLFVLWRMATGLCRHITWFSIKACSKNFESA